MLCSVTLSGYVRTLATRSGTATSSIRRFGSGEITVRPEKSTRFPERFPLNRPCFPLSLWQKPRIGFWPIWGGIPGSSELIYIATDTWRNSHCSWRRSSEGQPSDETEGTCHELGDWSTFGDPLFYECICKNYLCEFDGDVVLVRSSILSHGGTNANGRNGYVLPYVLFRSPEF